MFVLNFKKQFAPAVQTGDKRQTIRAKRKDGRVPHVEEKLRLYTGMRTSACKHLADTTCDYVATVQMFDDLNGVAVVIDGKRLSNEESYELAKADGFDTRNEFVRFFKESHKFPFEGMLIRW